MGVGVSGGLISLLNAHTAQTKDRSATGWFLASLFLGRFATIYLIFFAE
jgi:hypothetical protein